MTKYDIDDLCTMYFIVYDDGQDKRIQAWSNEKEYARIYMEFHKCKNFKLKTVTRPYKDIVDILNENFHDEIDLYNVYVKDETKKRNKKMITLPLTQTEQMLINDEAVTFMASRIDYSFIESAFYYLKGKYQRALKDIFLHDVMNKVIHEKQSLFTNDIEVDAVMILFREFPDMFGK